jgi:hypothetical protein
MYKKKLLLGGLLTAGVPSGNTPEIPPEEFMKLKNINRSYFCLYR